MLLCVHRKRMGQIAFKNPHSLQTLSASSFCEIFSAAPLQFFFLWQLQKFFCAHWLIFIVNTWTDTWIWNSCNALASKSDQFNHFFFVKNKSMSVCLGIDSEFHHNIVKVVCGSSRIIRKSGTRTIRSYKLVI